MNKILARALIVVAVLFMMSVSSVLALPDWFAEGDFDFDSDVDAVDASVFIEHFGRSRFFNPCPPDGPSRVPKTGQTTSYATGDDGDRRWGVPWPNPRFTDNDNGTVTDNLTGLIWLKDAGCMTTRTWEEAIFSSNVMQDGACGLTDDSEMGQWRLPNVRELMSLNHFGYAEPAVPNTAGTGKWSEGDPFLGVQVGNYWTSSIDQTDSTRALIVWMWTGLTSRDNRYVPHCVWPVKRGYNYGEPGPF